mgnify:CR=1 FL=1
MSLEKKSEKDNSRKENMGSVDQRHFMVHFKLHPQRRKSVASIPTTEKKDKHKSDEIEHPGVQRIKRSGTINLNDFEDKADKEANMLAASMDADILPVRRSLRNQRSDSDDMEVVERPKRSQSFSAPGNGYFQYSPSPFASLLQAAQEAKRSETQADDMESNGSSSTMPTNHSNDFMA